jgi:phage tail sheath protein FI
VYTRNAIGEKTLTSAAGAVAAALIAGERRDGVLPLHEDDPVMLRSGTRPACKLDSDVVHKLNKAGVNALTQRSALHLQLCGNVTQARYGGLSADWNKLQYRRQVLFILRRIRTGTRWTLFAESNADTWRDLNEQIVEFLGELHARSILAGETVRQAFFVKCDQDTNLGLEDRAGEVAFIVGFAVRNPGEFLAFRFQRTPAGCRVAELGWQARLELAS